MPDKPIVFVGSSREDLGSFPEDARREAGFQLRQVQKGFEPQHWKPMTTVGQGVKEIRIRAEDGQYRVFYVASFEDAIYVLHAFQKKTGKTGKQALKTGKRRYREVLNEQKARKAD